MVEDSICEKYLLDGGRENPALTDHLELWAVGETAHQVHVS